ncbi:MAG: DUF5666 domain-containing protein, partial [Candidatus Saccharimonadales bacterium]
MNKKQLLFTGSALAVAITGVLAFGVYAIGTAMQVHIDQNGNAQVQGTAAWMGQDALSVRSWGGNWTVQVASSTMITPNGTLSQIQSGDTVMVWGIADQNDSTIRASRVQDLTA